MTKPIGLIGLGIMGGAIAANLVAAGFDVVGFDTDAGARDAAAMTGVRLMSDSGAVARASEPILVCLPTAAAAREVAAAIVAADVAPRTIVELSTLALVDKLAIADLLSTAGHVTLDCPLSGTGAQAKVRDLVVFASGDDAAIDRLRPVFAGFAREVKVLGAYGNGSKMKFVANLLVAIHNVASAEAMVLAARAGLDPHQVIDVISAGAGTSRVFELRAPMMADATYVPATMRLRTWQKDMDVIATFARDLGVTIPLFEATRPIYDAALAAGRGEQDTAAVAAVLTSWSMRASAKT